MAGTTIPEAKRTFHLQVNSETAEEALNEIDEFLWGRQTRDLPASRLIVAGEQYRLV